MKCLGFALLVMAGAIAVFPRAIADPVSASNSMYRSDVVKLDSTSSAFANRGLGGVPTSDSALSQIPGQVTWSGYTYSDAKVVELSEMVGRPASSAALPTQDEIANSTPNDVSTVTGSALFKHFGPKPSMRTVRRSGDGSREATARGSGSASAPEPSSLVLLGTGLLCLAFLVFRKAKSSAVAVQKQFVTYPFPAE